MKKMWTVLIVSFVFLTMAACAGLTPAGDKVHGARGKVIAYQPGQMLELSGTDLMRHDAVETATLSPMPRAEEAGKRWIYTLTPATTMKGDVQVGSIVSIRYTVDQTGGMNAAYVEKVR
jgi:hypothetical protein